MRISALILVLLMSCTKVAPHKNARELSLKDMGGDMGLEGTVIQKPLGDYTCMGDLYVEPSTLHSIGLEWRVTGVLDQSAQVEVSYQVKGSGDWHQAMNLLRLNGELTGPDCASGSVCNPDAGTNPFGTCWPTENLFAGSILFLQPDTEYEVKLTATACKDGDAGSATITFPARTKKEPKILPLCPKADCESRDMGDMGARTENCGCQYELFPPTWKMPDDTNCNCTVPIDVSNKFIDKSICGTAPIYQTAMCQHFENVYSLMQPGDQLLIHAGSYPCFQVQLYKDAPREKPIVIRSAGDGNTILSFESPRLRGSLRGLAFQPSKVKFEEPSGAHWIEGFIFRDIASAISSESPVANLTFRNNSIQNYTHGITISSVKSRDIYISDNRFEGDWPSYGWQKDCGLCNTPCSANSKCCDVCGTDCCKKLCSGDSDMGIRDMGTADMAGACCRDKCMSQCKPDDSPNKQCYSTDKDCDMGTGKICAHCNCVCGGVSNKQAICTYDRDTPLYGISVAGQGIDVAYNEVHNAEDGLRVNGEKCGTGSTCCASSNFYDKRASIDFYGNHIHQIKDDNEADSGQHNIRFFKNVIVDAQSGFSSQPIYGGPAYFVRNFIYNATRGEPFKLANNTAGVYVLNNTTVSSYQRNICGVLQDTSLTYYSAPMTNIHIHNNLFLGIPAASQDHVYYNIRAVLKDNNKSSWDYNAYSFRCCYSPDHQVSTVCNPDMGMTLCPINVSRPPDAGTAQSMEEMKDKLGFEGHYSTVDFDDFVNLSPPAGHSYIVPYSRLEGIDYHLTPKALGKIKYMSIPNITDDKMPTPGALQGSEKLLPFGPRPPRP